MVLKEMQKDMADIIDTKENRLKVYSFVLNEIKNAKLRKLLKHEFGSRLLFQEKDSKKNTSKKERTFSVKSLMI